MVYITSKKRIAKHSQTSRDIYFESLEEAYGNLPVPSDDYADIRQLLISERLKFSHLDANEVEKLVDADLSKLDNAIETIRLHYVHVGFALDKQLKYSECTPDAEDVCSICKNPMKGWGNNAYPVSDGRCCNKCNDTEVIPARIKHLS